MRPDKRFKGFLLLQNMRLQDFVREGLANRTLGADDAARLLLVEGLNRREIARWSRDFASGGNCAAGPGHGG